MRTVLALMLGYIALTLWVRVARWVVYGWFEVDTGPGAPFLTVAGVFAGIYFLAGVLGGIAADRVAASPNRVANLILAGIVLALVLLPDARLLPWVPALLVAAGVLLGGRGKRHIR